MALRSRRSTTCVRPDTANSIWRRRSTTCNFYTQEADMRSSLQLSRFVSRSATQNVVGAIVSISATTINYWALSACEQRDVRKQQHSGQMYTTARAKRLTAVSQTANVYYSKSEAPSHSSFWCAHAFHSILSHVHITQAFFVPRPS